MTVINVCFHGIGVPGRALEPDEEGYWISQDTYARVLDEVAGRSDVALSFDDGNASDVELALHPLLERGLTATFFVLAGRLDRPGSVSTADLGELHRQGMTIGTHGMDHVPWRHLSESEQQRELVEARELISRAAGTPVQEAALPLGRYDRQVLSSLRRLDYRRVYSSDRRPARGTAWLQPRFSIRSTDTIDSVRQTVLTPPSAVHLARTTLTGVVKRIR